MHNIRIREVGRFVAVGITNAAVTFAIYVIFIVIGCPYMLANIFTWIIAIVFSYNMNAVFVFINPRNKPGHRRFSLFVLTYLISFTLSTSFLLFFVEYLGMGKVFAQLITLPIIALSNFILGKFMVFKTL